jgi:hypothetical protein
MDIKEEYFEYLEKSKEIARIQYDYFKHLSVLSTASIGAILAFIANSSSITYSTVLAGLSLICFFSCIYISLSGMIDPANIILYCTFLRLTVASEGQEEKRKAEVKEIGAKFKVSIDHIEKAARYTKRTFLLGIILFLAYVSIRFICNS